MSWDYINQNSGYKLYFCLGDIKQMDNKHTLIGKIINEAGLEVLSQLAIGDRLQQASIVDEVTGIEDLLSPIDEIFAPNN